MHPPYKIALSESTNTLPEDPWGPRCPKPNKTAEEAIAGPVSERAAELVWAHQPVQSPHPRQHEPQSARPATPTVTAFDVYSSTPSDFNPPWAPLNTAGACSCPASACSWLAIDFLASGPCQEQALFNGLLIGREAEKKAEAQLTRGQASCLLCLFPSSGFCLPECNGVGKALGLKLVARPKVCSGPFADSLDDLGQGLLSCKMGVDSQGMKGHREVDF